MRNLFGRFQKPHPVTADPAQHCDAALRLLAEVRILILERQAAIRKVAAVVALAVAMSTTPAMASIGAGLEIVGGVVTSAGAAALAPVGGALVLLALFCINAFPWILLGYCVYLLARFVRAYERRP
jgi:hypothetical protein